MAEGEAAEDSRKYPEDAAKNVDSDNPAMIGIARMSNCGGSFIVACIRTLPASARTYAVSDMPGCQIACRYPDEPYRMLNTPL